MCRAGWPHEAEGRPQADCWLYSTDFWTYCTDCWTYCTDCWIYSTGVCAYATTNTNCERAGGPLETRILSWMWIDAATVTLLITLYQRSPALHLLSQLLSLLHSISLVLLHSWGKLSANDYKGFTYYYLHYVVICICSSFVCKLYSQYLILKRRSCLQHYLLKQPSQYRGTILL